jgi:heptosyltransferase-1
MAPERILVVRLSAMGDIIHTLPAVASLRAGFPAAHVTWAVQPRWAALLEGNPDIDATLTVDRKSWAGVRAAWRAVRSLRATLAVDFQGLVQSALVAAASGAPRRAGYAAGVARENPAAWFYSEQVTPRVAHIVDQHLELAAAVGAAARMVRFPLPAGQPEGRLPEGPFVLASPLAGWRSKQWPLENYTALARLLSDGPGLPLVVNGAPATEAELRRIEGAQVHLSSVAGLIDATRRAAAVVGVDSGPLHLAAALGKPGVALFGPTEPARNGPYGGTLRVLRHPAAETTYRRGEEYAASMRAITPAEVFAALQ